MLAEMLHFISLKVSCSEGREAEFPCCLQFPVCRCGSCGGGWVRGLPGSPGDLAGVNTVTAPQSQANYTPIGLTAAVHPGLTR